jgi:hypothetical protein
VRALIYGLTFLAGVLLAEYGWWPYMSFDDRILVPLIFGLGWLCRSSPWLESANGTKHQAVGEAEKSANNKEHAG